jgi:hypothetical protein
MAVQGRGYYGIGAAKKDFGFSKNMTLPLSGGYGLSQADEMPTEGRSDKGHASFSVDKQGKVRPSRYQVSVSVTLDVCARLSAAGGVS